MALQLVVALKIDATDLLDDYSILLLFCFGSSGLTTRQNADYCLHLKNEAKSIFTD